MYHSDYTIRMIQQFVVFLGRIAGLIKKDDPRIALIEIEQAYRGILGMDPRLIHSMAPEGIIDLLRIQDDHAERIVILVLLLRRQAQTALQTGDPQDADRYLKKADRLLDLLGDASYSEELPDQKTILRENSEVRQEIDRFIQKNR